MRAEGLLPFVLLTCVVVILGVNNGAAVNSSDESMPVVDLDEDSVRADVASATPDQMQTSTFGSFGWGPPYPWWPQQFCSWDFWTSAAWQVTFVGKAARCSDATGRALAGLASRTVSSHRGIQSLLRGVVWAPVAVNPVLCAQSKSGQVTYTVRLTAPGPALARLRTNSGGPLMRSVFSTGSLRTLRLSGKAPCHVVLPTLTVWGSLHHQPLHSGAQCSGQYC
jgi:hypothetical protein